MFDEIAEKRPVGAASWLTVERAAYAVIALLAAAVRFLGLGLRPLGAAEAEQALAAYRFIAGELQVAPQGTLPALFAGNVAGFSLFGSGDAVARLLPAFAGVVLVLLPYALRHRIGRGGALAASLLLALSPVAAFVSGSASGGSLVAACGLALVVGLLNYADTHRPVWLYLAAGGLGLGLAAGPGIYTLLLLVGVYGLFLYVLRTPGEEGGWLTIAAAYHAGRTRPAQEGESPGWGLSPLGTAATVLVGVLALVATAFALHPTGIGHAADLLGAWVEGLVPRAGGRPVLYPLLLLLRYEPLILFLGVIEIVAWLPSRLPGAAGTGRRREAGFGLSHTAFFVFWAGVALLLALVAGGRGPEDVLLAVVPLALLGGQGVERVVARIGWRLRWSEVLLATAVAAGIGVFVYLQLAAYTQASAVTTVGVAGIELYAATTHLLLGLVGLLLVAGLGALAWLWRGPALVAAAGWLALVVVLGLWGFKGLWGANFAYAADPRALLVTEATHPEVRLLVEHLEALSLERAGDRHVLPVTVQADAGPVVAWYLRHFDAAEQAEGMTTALPTLAAVTVHSPGSGQGDPAWGEAFRGQSYLLRTHWMPWGLGGQGFMRWMLFTDAGQPVVDQEAILWVGQ
ncbi:MAG: glycosyltransferase family 39 protein [Anaerolineae bacterium]